MVTHCMSGLQIALPFSEFLLQLIFTSRCGTKKVCLSKKLKSIDLILFKYKKTELLHLPRASIKFAIFTQTMETQT